MRGHPPHELLGVRCSDDTENEYPWRNYITPTQIPWLRGLAIQGQILFPAAGFAAMALEASKLLADGEGNHLVEIRDFNIHRALAFADEAASVETLFTRSIDPDIVSCQESITAAFTCNFCSNRDTGEFTSCANGRLILRIGQPSSTALPKRLAAGHKLTEIDVDKFYDYLAGIGYHYTGEFRGISELRRGGNWASGQIFCPITPGYTCPFVLHPVTLDVVFQGVLAAIGAPNDGSLWTLQVPTKISRIKINPFALPPNGGLGTELFFDAGLEPSQEFHVV